MRKGKVQNNVRSIQPFVQRQRGAQVYADMCTDHVWKDIQMDNTTSGKGNHVMGKQGEAEGILCRKPLYNF